MLPTRAASAFHAAVHDLKVERLTRAARSAARELLAAREERMLANQQRFTPNITFAMPESSSALRPATTQPPSSVATEAPMKEKLF